MNKTPKILSLTPEENTDFENLLREKIKEFNNEVSPNHRAIRIEGAVTPLSISVANQDDQMIGGLYAETYWGWLEISYLWVAEEFRKEGIGSRLLRAAEEEAHARQCKYIKLSTFSFQAKDFYAKKGYSIVGHYPDYPPGEHYFSLLKKL